MMQEHWGRAYASVDLDLATLTRMVAPMLAPRAVVKASLLGGGLANTNYKIGVAGMRAPLVVRLFARDPSACQREVAVYELARDRVPVPHLIYVDTDGGAFGYPYTIAEWIDGEPMTGIVKRGESATIGASAYAAGWALASLAGITFPQAGFFGPTLDVVESMPASPAMLLAYLEPRLLGGLAGQRLGDAALRLWDFARQHAPLLEATAQQRSLIHGDYKAENLLARRVDDSWALAGVLDWEFAWAGAPLFDVAIFLRHDRELDPAFRTEFARGYRASGGLLPAGWRQLARLLDLFNLCGFLDEPGERGTLVADVTRLLLATMDRWDEDALVE